MEPWIETYTGRRFDLLDPQPEMICIEDIAHSLSQQCRFTGHTRCFYSVAEHCWHVSSLCPAYPLWGLLHDASEAYLTDLARPVKQATPIGPVYLAVEAKIMKAICGRFKLLPVDTMPKEVKCGDNTLLLAERNALMNPESVLMWDMAQFRGATKESVESVQIRAWTPQEAEQFFLERFDSLTGEK